MHRGFHFSATHFDLFQLVTQMFCLLTSADYAVNDGMCVKMRQIHNYAENTAAAVSHNSTGPGYYVAYMLPSAHFLLDWTPWVYFPVSGFLACTNLLDSFLACTSLLIGLVGRGFLLMDYLSHWWFPYNEFQHRWEPGVYIPVGCYLGGFNRRVTWCTVFW